MIILPTPSDLPSQIPDLPATYYADIPYRNKVDITFDMFVPTGGRSTKPWVLFLHGGGYISGSSSGIYNGIENETQLRALIAADITVISMNYSLIVEDGTETVGVSKAHNDVSVGIRYIKFNSTVLGIEKDNMGFYGRSAGAGALIVFCGRDWAEPDRTGTMWAESTRPVVVAAYRPQPYDVPGWYDYFPTLTFAAIFDGTQDELLERLYPFYGLQYPTLPDVPAAEDFYTTAIVNEREKLNTVANANPVGIPMHLENFSANVPPEPNNVDQLIHNPAYSQAFKEQWELFGEEVNYYTVDPPAESTEEFIISKLNV